MVADTRLFIRLGLLSFAGFVFYYAHLFFGIFPDGFMLKAVAVTFLLAAVPLPIIAINNRKLFPEMPETGKKVLTLATVLLLFHHFLMTFLFVLLLQGQGML